MKRNSDSELEELYAKRKKLDLRIALLEQETLENGLLEVLIHLVSSGALNILDLRCLSKTSSGIRKRTLHRTIWEHFSDNWLFRHYAEVSDLISPWGFLARLYRFTMYTDLDFQHRLTQAVTRTQSNLLLPGTIATRVQSTKDPTYRHLMGYIVSEKNIQFRFIKLGKFYRKYPMHQNFPLDDVYSRLHADIYLCCEGQAPVGLFQFLEILDNFSYRDKPATLNPRIALPFLCYRCECGMGLLGGFVFSMNPDIRRYFCSVQCFLQDPLWHRL